MGLEHRVLDWSHDNTYPPSGADRWMSCTASVRAIADAREKAGDKWDTSSDDSDEGVACHYILNKQLTDPLGIDEDDIIVLCDINGEERRRYDVTPERLEVVQRIVDYLDATGLNWSHEHHITYQVSPTTTATGTSDHVAYCKHTAKLHVGDAKFGMYAVPPVHPTREDWPNRQMGCYAWGKVLELRARNINPVAVVIHSLQPRLNAMESREFTMRQFNAWVEEELYARVRLISTNNVQFHPGEKECRYCPLSGRCEAQTAQMSEVATQLQRFETATVALDPMHRKWLFEHRDWIRKTLSALEEQLTKEALEGNALEGYRLARGRKGDRKFIDTPEARKSIVQLAADHEVACYTPPRLKTPTQLEKDVGKAMFEPFKEFVVQAEGRPILVPLNDKRPNYVRPEATDEDFE